MSFAASLRHPICSLVSGSAMRTSKCCWRRTLSTRTASQRSSTVESFKVMDVLKRANELMDQGHQVLHCEIGQPQTGAPKAVAQAAVDALQTPSMVMGYTNAFGLLELREQISRHYQDYYKTNVPASRIVVTTGSSGAFLLAFTACFDPGDAVAIASSGYPCYRNILSALDCPQVNIPVNAEFKLTATELETEISKQRQQDEEPITGLILSSPSNPTGAMLSCQELQNLCQLCDDQGIQFISDEIYHGISYGKQEATAVQYSPNAIVINSFSKFYSMSGWRLGWMIIPESLIEPIECLQQNMFINAPTISQTAALKCWSDEALQELNGYVDAYRSSRKLILQELSRNFPELDPSNIAPADGGFYVYIDLGENNVAPGFGSIQMCQALLEEEHVAFTPGNDFEDPATELGNRRFRISYAGGLETAKLAMERFHRFWPTWLERVRQAK